MATDDTPLVTIESLPAGHGDALWVEVHGDPPWRMLVDAGTPGTARRLSTRMNAQPDGNAFDLFVVTHIDVDHIGGAVKLLGAVRDPPTFGDVWFNGYEHLAGVAGHNDRGARQGEALAALLTQNPTAVAVPWNQAFDGDAIVTSGDGTYRRIEVAPGVQLILLTPTPADLARLRTSWDKELAAYRAQESNTETDQRAHTTRGKRRVDPAPDVSMAEIAATITIDDTAPANGSSIAFLMRVQRDGRTASVLFGADAHPPALCASLWQLAEDEGTDRISVDLLKLPHHASQANVTSDLLGLIETNHYLVSTNGAYFGHPDPVALARIAEHAREAATISFNYDKPSTRWFRDRCTTLGLEPRVPTQPDTGAVITLN